ncbi:MAG: F0F1 ATP synthase subunit A [Bdellovibrionales bacterium]|nr:F0F1 ATP synthase subunit A [Bdellovibrionales bacterium]
MESHYTYLDGVIEPVSEIATGSQKMVIATLVALFFVALGVAFRRHFQLAQTSKDALIPPKKINTFWFFDLLMETFVKYHDSVVGKANRKHIPFTASIFFFIFSLNLLGLIPGMPAATTTVWLNVGMALVVFIHFNWNGVREHGVAGYLKHFMGPVWWIAPLIFVLEILSTCLRILTLNLRLYWNISADHIVLSVFTKIMNIEFFPIYGALAFPFYGIGLFVAFMQAFIFTTLTMVYILLATEHGEEH